MVDRRGLEHDRGPCAVSAKRYTAHSMPASPAYEALLHQAAVGRLLPVPAQPVTQRGGQFVASIVGNCQPSRKKKLDLIRIFPKAGFSVWFLK